MLSTCQTLGVFSRALSRHNAVVRISEWVSTCRCSTAIINTRFHWSYEKNVVSWDQTQHSKDDNGGKYWQLPNSRDASKGGWSQNFQQISNNVVPKDKQWKDKVASLSSELQLSVKSCVHCKNSANCVGNDVKVNLNVASSLKLSQARYRNYNEMRPLLTLGHLSHSHLYHGVFANRSARHIHTLLNLKNGKGYSSNCMLLRQDIVDRKMVKRFKSSHPFFKKLVVKFFKEKDLEAKVKELKKFEAERSKKETETKSDAEQSKKEEYAKSRQLKKPVSEKSEGLGNLIYGCISSKHLLDLIVPWIESNSVSVEDTVKSIEHLQSLVYGEIMQEYPDLPYESVSVMFQGLKLLGVEEKVFSVIHDHFTFQKLIAYLEQNAESLSKGQFVSCFLCLTHLGVSHLDPIMTKFYTRIMNGDEDGYSIKDIVNLYHVALSHSNTGLVVAAYVLPKLSRFLRVMDSSVVDVDTFRALVFVANNVPKLKEADKVTLYSRVYKASIETDCLNDLSCACELVSHLSTTFYKQKHLAEVTSVYFQILETHKKNVIQIMSDMCLEIIEERSKELSPLKILKLKSMFSTTTGSLYRTRISITSQVEYLLKRRINELSLPELIWVMSFPSMFKSDLEPEVIAAICRKFDRLDLPNLYQTFLYMNYAHLGDSDVRNVITEKTQEYLNEISQHEQIFHRFMVFTWGVWFKTKKSFNRDFELAFQNSLLETYQNSYVGLKTSFATSVLMTLARVWSLQPTSLHMLSEISKKDAPYQTLSQGNLFVILHSVYSREFNNLQKNENIVYEGNPILYETVLFRILYKSLAEFYRTMSRDVFVLHAFIKTTNLLMLNYKMEPLLQSAAYEKLSKSPLVRMDDFREICKSRNIANLLIINTKQRETFLNTFVTFVLENKELFTFNDWRMIVKFLIACKYRVGDNKDLQNLLQTVVYQEFSFGANFCIFVNLCCRLGVDMSKALKTIFSVEYLKTTDQLITDKILEKSSMEKVLFLLNQIVCISYPELKVPWFQERDDVVTTWARQIDGWKYIPQDLSHSITKVAGGNRFVGKEVFLDYGFPAWRVLLIDQQNKLVKFSIRNLKLADEMKLKRLIIWFHDTFGAYDIQYDLLKQAGYSVVVIHRSEWNSIGIGMFDDKLQFLRERLFEHKDDMKVQVPTMRNCERVSSQWKKFLEAKL